ncbi:MAG: sensor hybrid histidine kinase [Phycisphaerales bacterium]|nr:sensor hybrid histidine kinase [Phycisphaerales bacterium]
MPFSTPGQMPEATALPATPQDGLSFDDLAKLIAAICRTPVGAVRFVGEPIVDEAGRSFAWEDSICRYAAASDQPLVLDDVSQDSRFADKDYVAGPPHLRFYAAAPLITSTGDHLGVLSVMDVQPRQLDAQQLGALCTLAHHVTNQLELRRLRTEQIRTEAALRQAGELLGEQMRRQSMIYDTALAEISDFTYVFDRQHCFVFANRRMLKLWDTTADLAIGKTMKELNYPVAVLESASNDVEQVFITGQSVSGENDYASPNGQRAIYEHIFSPVFASDGSVEFVAGCSRDVTQIRANEKALRSAESRARFLSELSETTRDLIDPAQVLHSVATRLGQHLGTSRCAYADVHDGNAFTIGRDYTNGCDSCAGDYTLDAFGSFAATKMREGRTLVLRDIDKELAPADGADVFNSISIKAIICCPLVRAGRLVAMMAVHQTKPRDWTEDDVLLVQEVVERAWAYLESARAKRERVNAFERLSLAQQAGRVGSFDWLIPENRIIWQPELEALYGMPAGSFEGNIEGWRKRVVPEDLLRVEPQLQSCMDAGQTECSYDFRIILPTGGIRWMNGKARFEYDLQGKPLRMIGVNYDTTEQHDLIEARESLLDSERSARTEAERVSRMKDEFLATLSHELRTPLNAILGWSQILRSSPPDSDEINEGLDVIERNARSQAQIIEDLLDMSRIISGKIRLDVQRLDVASVIQAALDTVRPAATAKGVRLHVVLDPNTGPVSGDPGRLQQTLWNLLSNAIKFTPKGGRVQVLLERVNSHVEISVSDTGQGIKSEFLPYVFDRFRQADASTTRQHGGLGIGLALVKQLVELHGGTVRAKSLGEGAGSTFVLTLPLTILHAEPDDAAARRHPAHPVQPGIPHDACVRIEGIRVLVIDDEPDARALVRRLLEDCHAKVQMAGSASEALECLQTVGPFDVIVSDIGMPGEDGYSLIRRIRALSRDRGGQTPAIALTAYARSEDRMRSVIAGFQMHIPKPVEPAELITMVASLAGRTNPN